MNEMTVKRAERDARDGFWIGGCRALVLRSLRDLRYGTLRVVEGDAVTRFGRGDGPDAELRVLDPRFWPDVVLGGSVGAGESYVAGRWTSEDLVALVRVLAGNAEANAGVERGPARLRRGLERIRHALRSNTRRGSRRNILAHYDLGNDFYRLFLDRTMTYSSTIFPSEDATLDVAADHKNETVCRRLALRPGDRVLEIGSGWGGFAIHAAGRHGCRVVTVTISPRQHRLATERVRAAGLEGRVEVLLEDYRDLPRRLDTRFDALVSVEMVEAVGHAFLDRFFGVCGAMLHARGRMLLQAIVMPDRHHEAYLRSVDFIRTHVFPGGCLPSIRSLNTSATRASDLGFVHLADITPHYARTLQEWRRRFLDRIAEVRALGFDERFVRLWEYYLAYCEGAFRERAVGCYQMLFAKPRFGVEAA